MSGMPVGENFKNPNWIITASQKSHDGDSQWDEIAMPYWKDLNKYALNLGIDKVTENHGMQLVHNEQDFFFGLKHFIMHWSQLSLVITFGWVVILFLQYFWAIIFIMLLLKIRKLRIIQVLILF